MIKNTKTANKKSGKATPESAAPPLQPADGPLQPADGPLQPADGNGAASATGETKIQLEQIPPLTSIWLTAIAAVLLSFIVVGIIIFIIGQNPITALSYMILGVFSTPEGIGYALFYATNFIFTGLAVSVAFHAGLFNIGGEGQAAIGGLVLTAFLLTFDTLLPGWLLLLLAPFAAMLGGIAWAGIPAWLNTWRGSHVVITTIMFNFIAYGLVLWLVTVFLIPVGTTAPESREFIGVDIIPLFHNLLGWLGVARFYSPLNISFIVALAVAMLVWLLIYRSRSGYEIRVFGQNPQAASFAGINKRRIVLMAMALSGGLAGLMAINEVLFASNKLIAGFTAGYGFVGIAVSLMGRNHPAGIVIAALLFGFLYQGGTELNIELPQISREMVVVIQGLIILFVGALANLLQPKVALGYGYLMRMLAEPQANLNDK